MTGETGKEKDNEHIKIKNITRAKGKKYTFSLFAQIFVVQSSLNCRKSVCIYKTDYCVWFFYLIRSSICNELFSKKNNIEVIEK